MFSIQYIEMCMGVNDLLQSIRRQKLFKEAKGELVIPKSLFENYDYFHCPEKMEKDEVKQVEKILGEDIYATDGTGPYKESDCIWIPEEKQIKEVAERYNLSEVSLEDFLRDNKYSGYRTAPRHIFRAKHEQWLAHFMNDWREENWDIEKKKWIKREM